MTTERSDIFGFIALHAMPYDPATDAYSARFSLLVEAGKNAAIYNTHWLTGRNQDAIR